MNYIVEMVVERNFYGSVRTEYKEIEVDAESPKDAKKIAKKQIKKSHIKEIRIIGVVAK